MKIVRTIVWVLLLVGLAIFSFANWDPPVTVRIWQGIVVDTRIPAVVIVAFLVGFLPMWLLNQATNWQSRRKIQSLESAVRTAEATPIVPPPAEQQPAPTTVFSETRDLPPTEAAPPPKPTEL